MKQNAFEDPTIDIPVDDLIEMVKTHLMGAIESTIDYLAQVAWSFIPGNSAVVFTAATLTLLLLLAMIYPIKIMLERSRA